MLIKRVSAKSIKDSRNKPTIEVTINGQKASAPSGKSTGKAETPEYRKSLKQSIKDINSLKLSNLEINYFQDLSKIESQIKNQFKLSNPKIFGANALIALEIAILKALSKEKNLSLYKTINPKAKRIPTPVGNAIGGGLHSSNKNHTEFQEFLLIPQGKNVRSNIQIMKKIHTKLKSLTKSKKKNDEGAWQTSLSNEQILKILSKFKEVRIGMDVAASSFYKKSHYLYKNISITKQSQIKYINSLIKKYNILYTEDPLEESDFSGFSQIKHTPSHLVVGDDLTATQIVRVKRAIKQESINALIIKPNQNGSLLEIQTIFQLCKKHNIKTILSHRSGETLDSALSDLAVGFQADYIKTGIATKWREAKLERLIQIEKSIK
jgi:enolase